MNIRYKIQHSRPKLVKIKGLACLRAFLSNASVETTITHMDLTAGKSLIKEINIQKNDILIFGPISKKSAEKHQPFQPKMISKLVSIK